MAIADFTVRERNSRRCSVSEPLGLSLEDADGTPKTASGIWKALGPEKQGDDQYADQNLGCANTLEHQPVLRRGCGQEYDESAASAASATHCLAS